MSEEILQEQYQASVKLQMTLFVTLGIFLAWLLYQPIRTFKSNDEFPQSVSLTPRQIIDMGGAPTFVDVGLYVRDIPVFDMVKGTLLADATVWFLFDPNLVSLDRLGMFTFDRGDIVYKSEPYTRLENQKLLARYDMRIEFALKLDYKDFPIDDHRINFSMTNPFISSSEVIFQSSRTNLLINKEIKLPGWGLVEQDVKTGFLFDKDHHKAGGKIYHPRAVFSIDFARIGFRHIMVIIMPLLLIFMIALFTWTFNPFGGVFGNIIGISIMSITAVITHHFVIETISPKTGYLMISNYIFLLILANCCLIFLGNVMGRRIKGIYKNIAAIMMYLAIALFLTMMIKPLF
jgi:hypothetical protein